MRHVPDVLFGMVQIDNLHRLGKLFAHQVPNPWRAIPEHHDLLRALESTLHR